MQAKYLHQVSPGIYYLDHRLTPEVRAMFCAMASRMPIGGIAARYTEVVGAVAEDLFQAWLASNETAESSDKDPFFHEAEDLLCSYPLHPKVQGFFDKFVAQYGHSSIMELSGSPSVYIEGISWYTAYLLFDNPLVAGQEFSTRAVRHKDWPMARELMPSKGEAYNHHTVPGALEEYEAAYPFRELHDRWFEVFEAEVEAWKQRFSDPAVRKEYGISDNEPFRPALDRARWAIPGTIATGCSQTANMRVMARVINDGSLLAQRAGCAAAVEAWDDIRAAYGASLPGMAGMGLREAIYDDNAKIPGHLQILHIHSDEPEDEVLVSLLPNQGAVDPLAFSREVGARSYVDPSMNGAGLVGVNILCSLAVSRDWHRHRTFYPWRMYLIRDQGPISIHPAYEPISDLGKEKLPDLLKFSTDLYDKLMAEGDSYRAMMTLPLGTLVEMSAWGGLRDAIYMFELRANAHGANFEYKAQAESALKQIRFYLQCMEGDVDFCEMLGMEEVFVDDDE